VVFVLRRQKRNGTDSFHFGSVLCRRRGSDDAVGQDNLGHPPEDGDWKIVSHHVSSKVPLL
jgi:hypothetical protein